MPPQTIILTGAPLSKSLDWDSSNLLEDFTAPIARFTGLNSSFGIPTHSFSSEPRHASWRSLDFDRKHLPTGHSPGHVWTEEYQGDADFFNTSKLSFTSSNSNLDTSQSRNDQRTSLESTENVLSQFYVHSFALHTTQASSQAARSQSEDALTCHRLDTGNSFTSVKTTSTSKTDSFLASSPRNTSSIMPEIPVWGNTVDLKDIPDAKLLDSIQPQTMTVNMIVGIISAAPPRAIKTHRGADVELIELLVGDETKAGFGVNFWLSTCSDDISSGKFTGGMRHAISSLRTQDIVLLQNVALSSFRKMVYGQSLKKDVTKLHLLYRNRVDRTDMGGYYTASDLDEGRELHGQLRKMIRVRDWVLRFVPPRPLNRNAGTDNIAVTDSLPLDTQ